MGVPSHTHTHTHTHSFSGYVGSCQGGRKVVMGVTLSFLHMQGAVRERAGG